ncbi:MAG: SpoIIE family protein phosphatase, partial [Clostridia bacterium]|nr:SpoIIE family protein phosphatase [Clostridia bacterium]
RQGIKSGNEEFPSHFKMKCSKTEKLAAELRASILKKKDFKIEYAKCSEPKTGERVCGDNCCVFSSGNRQIICLADGMCSGPEAAKESVRSSRLLENLISKGVEKEDAIKVINETLIKSEYETVLALDLTIIDLKTGLCEFIKAGAAPTYIIRNGSLYELGSRSVPIGILDEISLEYERSKLISGDIILMISDGMIADGSEWLSVLVRGLSKAELQSPLLLSDGIMTAAKHLKKNLSDDLTVIAAKIV